MAKVIVDEPVQVVKPWWDNIKVPVIGLIVGVLWWGLTSILRTYVVEPLACRDLSSAAVCVDAFGVAGSVAAILVALLGIGLLIRIWQPRPVIIALATLALLWSLGSYLQGLHWAETLVWSLALYAVSYVVFSFVVRIRLPWVALVVAVLIVLAIRLLLAV